MSDTATLTPVHVWGRATFTGHVDVPQGSDPLRDIVGQVRWTSPSGATSSTPLFWDGGSSFKSRAVLTEPGRWSIEASATHSGNPVSITPAVGDVECAPYEGSNPLYKHGHPRHRPGTSHLEYADGTPFLWIGDTAWNGPMVATDEDWDHYAATRQSQGVTVSQFVTSSWRALPDAGPHGPALVLDGNSLMGINPGFFEILDARLDALVDHGIAGVPVLLWAIETTEVDPGDVVMIEDSTIDPDTVPAQPVIEHNPGQFLSEDDAVVLARYLVARWHAHPVVFILNGDGDYAGEKAERWHRIGREVFGTDGNAGRPPVAVHPGGIQWVGPEFADEPWVDIIGYQSGHGGGILSWRWLQDGPLTKEAHTNSHQAIINLEACYEDHNRMYVMIGVPAGWVGRFTARDTRRALYASFLVSAPAGATYGAHGVWAWDEGGKRPKGHYTTGVTKSWREALQFPGAEGLLHLRTHLQSMPWWDLRPAQSLVLTQPGDNGRFTSWVTAAQDVSGSVTAVYFGSSEGTTLDLEGIRGTRTGALMGEWRNPRDGSVSDPFEISEEITPPEGEALDDWLLVIRQS